MIFRLAVFLLLLPFSLVLLTACEKKQGSSDQEVRDESVLKHKTDVISDVLSIPVPPAPPFSSVEEPILSEPIEEIPKEYTFSEQLVQAALERTTHDVTYDGRYLKIDYPMGDVPDSIGVCTDVVIRSYRQLGIDLQQLVHEDIRQHFKLYPNQKRWGLTRPDTNIDHRRVPNLRIFFSRHGESLAVTDDPVDYLPGDLVTWQLNDKMVHIGIVSDEKGLISPDQYLIIHNIGRGPELGDILFDFEVTGHYRYGFTIESDDEELL